MKIQHLAERTLAAVCETLTEMAEPECTHGVRDMLRFFAVEAIRGSRLDIAKSAGPGADTPENHHGGVAPIPTLSEIGAGRFFAHGVQA